jgi:DNA polymerase III delta prime subunit
VTETKTIAVSDRQAATELPDLADIVGNERVKEHMLAALQNPPGTDENILIQGEPGTAKTNMAIAYLRQRFKNPLFWNGDVEEFRRANPKVHRSPDDIRLHQRVEGQRLMYVGINGGTD